MQDLPGDIPRRVAGEEQERLRHVLRLAHPVQGIWATTGASSPIPWPYLERYLEDGRLELSNNRAERSIKPFVMGRKNFLFANTEGSATIYSLIETAKENGLDPYRYLVYVLTEAPALAAVDEDWADKLLPENAPKECRNS